MGGASARSSSAHSGRGGDADGSGCSVLHAGGCWCNRLGTTASALDWSSGAQRRGRKVFRRRSRMCGRSPGGLSGLPNPRERHSRSFSLVQALEVAAPTTAQALLKRASVERKAGNERVQEASSTVSEPQSDTCFRSRSRCLGRDRPLDVL